MLAQRGNQGESGTGKELVAREIHQRSRRSQQPLIRVNCASVPRELYESEFFGHAKGAFTGAIKDRPGRFAAADGGTLLLDEVGEIPPELQSKLLRVLQEKQYERWGRNHSYHQCPDPGRQQSRPESRSGGGPLPPGPLLPAQRVNLPSQVLETGAVADNVAQGLGFAYLFAQINCFQLEAGTQPLILFEGARVYERHGDLIGKNAQPDGALLGNGNACEEAQHPNTSSLYRMGCASKP